MPPATSAHAVACMPGGGGDRSYEASSALKPVPSATIQPSSLLAYLSCPEPPASDLVLSKRLSHCKLNLHLHSGSSATLCLPTSSSQGRPALYVFTMLTSGMLVALSAACQHAIRSGLCHLLLTLAITSQASPACKQLWLWLHTTRIPVNVTERHLCCQHAAVLSWARHM